MQITLSPEVQAIVEADLANGSYKSAEEYVAEATELLHEHREQQQAALKNLREKVEAGWQEMERGELLTEEQVLIEMQTMKARFLAGRSAA